MTFHRNALGLHLHRLSNKPVQFDLELLVGLGVIIRPHLHLNFQGFIQCPKYVQLPLITKPKKDVQSWGSFSSSAAAFVLRTDHECFRGYNSERFHVLLSSEFVTIEDDIPAAFASNGRHN